MSSALQADLHQGKPFSSLQQEAWLSVIRTSTLLQDQSEEFFRSYGITATQYNVLRILRGAGPDGLCRNALRDRMLTRMPDVTRLLDRMADDGLVVRTRETDDRRMVTTRVTAKGRELLRELDPLVLEMHRRTLSHLSKAQLRSLVDVLAQMRHRP